MIDNPDIGLFWRVVLVGIWFVPIVVFLLENKVVRKLFLRDWAWLRKLSRSGPLADIFRHRFSTKYLDPETGLYYYGYRFYHPSLMGWLNRDPIEEEGGENLYAFCLNNPNSHFDTDGRFVLPFLVIANPDMPQVHPIPSPFEQLGSRNVSLNEEKWFEDNYAAWLVNYLGQCLLANSEGCCLSPLPFVCDRVDRKSG